MIRSFSILPFFIFLYGLLFASNLSDAQTLCSPENVLCLYTKENGDDLLMTMVVRSSDVKWASVGFGQNMEAAEVYIAYFDEQNSPIVSRRASQGRRQPDIASNQNAKIVTDSNTSAGRLNNGIWYVTFSRPKASTQGNYGVEVSAVNSGQRMIWAYGSIVTGTGTSAIVSPHASANTGSEVVDLYKSSSAFNTSIIETLNAVQSNSVDRSGLYVAHGIVMFLAWQIFAPALIAVARFFKAKLGIWWFRIHVVLSIVGVGVLTAVGFALSFKANSGDHFTAKGSLASGFHTILGLIILIITIFQLFWGYMIDFLWTKNRKEIPWWDKLHWWSGRLLYIFAFINLPVGIFMYKQLFVSINIAIWIIYFIWSVFIFVSFFLLNKKFGQTHHDNIKKKMKVKTDDGDEYSPDRNANPVGALEHVQAGPSSSED